MVWCYENFQIVTLHYYLKILLYYEQVSEAKAIWLKNEILMDNCFFVTKYIILGLF